MDKILTAIKWLFILSGTFVALLFLRSASEKYISDRALNTQEKLAIVTLVQEKNADLITENSNASLTISNWDTIQQVKDGYHLSVYSTKIGNFVEILKKTELSDALQKRIEAASSPLYRVMYYVYFFLVLIVILNGVALPLLVLNLVINVRNYRRARDV